MILQPDDFMWVKIEAAKIGVEVEELEQVGFLALLEAARSFHGRMEYSRSYTKLRVTGAMKDHLQWLRGNRGRRKVVSIEDHSHAKTVCYGQPH